MIDRAIGVARKEVAADIDRSLAPMKRDIADTGKEAADLRGRIKGQLEDLTRRHEKLSTFAHQSDAEIRTALSEARASQAVTNQRLEQTQSQTAALLGDVSARLRSLEGARAADREVDARRWGKLEAKLGINGSSK